ncbi:MAG TPA: transglutaminase domain-containing protein [Cyclobacteriaceae bacterium]|nr:transglutaminase domain-containing protein [Cyclobacteriaceae bacterium]
MRNTLCLLFCTLLLCASGLAQKAPIKFGDIPMEDMKMKVYPLDSGASAVVLADYGTSNLVYTQTSGFQIDFERIRRVKILTKEGLNHAEFTIALWRDAGNGAEEKLSGLKLVTYNLENGKIVETKVKNDSFFKEKYDKNLSFTKCAWTNVKEGSVIEITYKVKSDFLFNFQDWEFQSDIPARWSEYRARIPEYFNYQKYMQGYVGLVISDNTTRAGSLSIQSIQRQQASFSGVSPAQTSQQTVEYQEENFRWAAKDVPAFKKEPYITTSSNYISKINFELAFTRFPNEGTKNYMGTWEDINVSYWGVVKPDINSNAGLKDDVERVTAGATTDEQKAAMIFDHVRSSVLWDGNQRRYPELSPRKAMDVKKGSSADINILLACMLDKAGIDVSPVLLSTRDHGWVRESVPISTQFNYVVCLAKFGDKRVLLDATDRVLPIGVLPERCLNGKGLVVSGGEPSWISLQPTVKSRTVYSADVILAETGVVKGTLKIDKTGYASASARRKYYAQGEDEYLKEITQDPVWTFSNSVFENVNDINLPFKERHEIVATEVGMAAATTIYFSPFVAAREDENPFKSETREYPVDFGNHFEQLYVAKIALPEGYVVDELPPSKMLALPDGDGKYAYSLSQQGNIRHFTSSLTINRSIFTQDIYPSLREFYNLVVAKQAEQIVLKKK